MKRTMISLTIAAALAGGALAQAAMTEAEVRKVDAAGGKITLKHGEIKSLDMPPMTMVYRVKNSAQLGKLQPGDKVKFSAEKIGGQYTVTAIEEAR